MPQKLPVTGLRQSPIDISTNGLQRAKRSTAAADLPTLSVDYSTLTGADGLTVENTGHGWKLNIPDELAQRCPISGGPLGGNRYRLLQVHAHWGHDSSVGSEHTIDGVSYPCEIHLVHWNATKYGNAAEAMEYHADGLAVIGVFVRTASESAALNDALQTIVAALPRIPFKGDRAPLDASIDLNSFIVDRDAPKYWHYEGSLTTPPYSESVMWIVMRDPIDAKDSQLESFRRMNKNDSTADQAVPLKANYRKVQELNNRPISTFD